MQHTLTAPIILPVITSLAFDNIGQLLIAQKDLLNHWNINSTITEDNRLTADLTDALENSNLYSDIFDSKEKGEFAKNSMLTYWGIDSKLEPYDSEPKDDGYDLDKYH
jgi:hypothetical protein